MASFRCDACGQEGPRERRFVIAIEIFAPFDGLEIDADELARDHAAELAALARRLEELDADEAQDDVHRAFRFTLCRSCQRTYLRNPLDPAWADSET